MKPSQKLKFLRERVGLEPLALAAASGISVQEYYDLEATDDLENCIELYRLRRLAAVLRVRLVELFSFSVPEEEISPTALRSILERHMKTKSVELPQLEDEIGWELLPFMNDPQALLQWNMTCLYDVCRVLGCSWVSVLNGLD